MKRKWGIWDWLYVAWTLLVGVLALWAFSAAASENTLSEALNDFRRTLVHVPGRGIGRSSRQLCEERAGNAMELTNACMDYLTQLGYDCRVVFGRALLSPAQAAAWTALPAEALQQILGDEAHPVVWSDAGLTLDLPWLQVLSRDLWGFGVADDNAAIWVNVFPALIAQSRVPDDSDEAMIAAATRLAQGLVAVSAVEYGVGGMEAAIGIQRFPATLAAGQLAQCLPGDDAVASSAPLTTGASLPGYRAVNCLSPAPVAILEEYGSCTTMPSEHRASVVFRLLLDDREILCWQGLLEEIGNQLFSLQWRDLSAETGGAMTGDGMRGAWQPLLNMGGHVVAEGKPLSEEGLLTLVCCRYADAAATIHSDQLSYAIEARRECRWLLSSGTMAPPVSADDADAVAHVARSCAYLLDCQRRIAAAEFGWQDCASLRVLLLQNCKAATGATTDDDASVAGMATSWRLLFPEEQPSVYACTAAGLNPEACRHAWSMAMAFAPMLALEWLAHAGDGKTVTSPLNVFRDALRRQSQWLWLPEDTGIMEQNGNKALAPWLALAAAEPKGKWLGACARTSESSLPVCAWPEAQNICRLHIMSSAGSTALSAPVISLSETTGDDSGVAPLDLFCRTYQRTLALIRHLSGLQRENIPEALKDLTALALLVGLTEEATVLPRMESISAPAYWSRASGDCPIQLQLVQSTWWSLNIENAAGEIQWRQHGTDCAAELRWPLHDLRQQPCADGSYFLCLRAGDGQRADEQRRCLVLDSQPPSLSLELLNAMSSPAVRYLVNDASPTTAELILSDDADKVLRRWDTLPHNTPVELLINSADLAADRCFLTLCAEDAAGNRAQKELVLELPNERGVLPELRLRLVGHDSAEPVLTTDTRLEVLAKGIDGLQECALFLDGDILLAVTPGPLLMETFYLSQWPAGRHVLQAVAWDETGAEYLSASIACHIRPEDDDDDLPPILDVALDGWPPDESSTLTVSAWDNCELQSIRIWLGGELLREENFSPGSQEGTVDKLPIPASALARGLWLQASDRAGNLRQRLLRYPDAGAAGGEKPVVVLCSPQLNDGPLLGDIVYQLYKESAGELAYLSLQLNGELLLEHFFPWESEFAGVIPLTSCRSGENLLELRAVGVNGLAADSVVACFTVPIIVDMMLTPALVCGWAGDNPMVTLTATLRQDCAWTASVPAVPAVAPQHGYGSEVQWSFSSADFADGSYQVRIDLPDLGRWRECSLAVDHQRGEVIARITQPGAGVLKEAVVSVMGSACYSEDGHEVGYQLAVKDERGEWLIVCPRQNDPHCAALLPARACVAAASERRLWLDGAVSAAELALLDLSGLPDGRYELHLEVVAAGQRAADQVVFQLASELKSGPFTWQEEDLRLPAGNMMIKATRKYASDSLQDGDFGPGWSLNLSAMDVIIPEERAERMDVFGDALSIRQGGSRDVCVTLPDGRRTTFVYELVPGGGTSFCYYAQWRAPDAVAATLAPTVSNKLMTLPGLAPYWEAAGMATPWENYDFPGFVLSCQDGSKYLLEREFLGDAELLVGGTDGLDGGVSYAHVAAYGPARLREITTRDGERIVFASDKVSNQSLDGRIKDIMKIERGRDGDKRITAIETLHGEPLRLEYAYDELGRLVQLRHCNLEQAPQLRRSYSYDDERFPYHLTAIRDGRGALLFAQRFDTLGRLCATTNADGAETTVLRDSIAGVELRTDPLGHETTILHDARGMVSAVVAPDGALTSYEYDAKGRESAVTNPLGEKSLALYDDSGRLQARVEPLGQRTDYVYADNGRCRRIVDPLGRLTDYTMNEQGRNTRITTATGDVVTMSYDAQGRVSSFTGGEGMAPVLVSYDERGRPEAFTDMRGLQIQSEYDGSNNLAVKTLRFFTDGGSQISELSVAADYDDEGRPTNIYDSLNNWQKTTYDYRGRASQESTSGGQCLNRRFDVMDRVVETWDDAGVLWRFLYDAAGQQVLAAGPFVLPENQREQPPDILSFPQAERRQFDVCGRLCGTKLLRDVIVLRDELGDGQYRCQLLAGGSSVANATRDYDAAGRLRFTRSLTGVEQSFEYDANGRCISVRDGVGRGYSKEYDAIGNVTAMIDAAGNQTLYSYDERGLPTAHIDPGGAITLTEYDAQGRLRLTQNPAGLLTVNSFTSAGQLSSVRLCKNGDSAPGNDKATRRAGQGSRARNDDDSEVLAEYSYEYNAMLGLAAIVDPLGRRQEIVMDEFGRECRRRLPLGQECTARYDSGARLPARRSDFLGNSIACSYDAQGNLCEKQILPLGDAAGKLLYRYRYDAFGRCKAITLAGGDDDVAETLLTCDYNAADRIVCQNNAGVVLQREYDADRRLIRQWTEHTDLHYDYDAGGALATILVRKAAGRELSQREEYGFEYDKAGHLCRLSRPDGSTSSFAVDGRGLITSIRHDTDNRTLLQESSYEYDLAGRCVSAVDSWSDDGAQRRERRRSYRYDALGRLCREESWCEGLAAYCYSEESSYDAVGNRVRIVHLDERGTMTVRSLAYDDNDRLLKEEVQNATESYQVLYTWDANGSLLSRDAGGAYPERRRYAWDAENRLATVHIDQPNAASGAVYWSVFYDYDARGMLCGYTRERRQNQLVERSRYRLVMTPPEPGGMPVLLECQLLEGTAAESLQSFIHAGQPLARYGADGLVWQYAGDRLGTKSSERSGAMQARQGYDAHGVALLPSRETPSHGFTGEWQDPITGLVYLRSRFYAPDMGTFISRDAHPGELSQPMSLHKYVYCLNDPVNRCDPSGCFSILGTLMSICSALGHTYKVAFAYRRPLSIATELYFGLFSLSDFIARDAEKNNATVVVHGVAPHFPGYSKALADGLEKRIDNQDYYEFLWSGFTLGILPWYPNPLQHDIAKASLRSCLLEIKQKGYRHLSLIGHSWGTVLSLDALEHRDSSLHTWVTMGSPLPKVTPRFSFYNWLNVFSASDPVVYLMISPFTRPLDGDLEPLFMQDFLVEQYGVSELPLLEAHSCYWTDYMTIKQIANLLKAQ